MEMETQILCALLQKYTLKTTEDQNTVTQLACELAECLRKNMAGVRAVITSEDLIEYKKDVS